MARAKVNEDKLTKQQEVFVNELVKGSSQRQAYIKAYPSKKNWKETSLDCEASKLLSKTKVRQRYNELLNKTGIVKEVGRYFITVKSSSGSTEQWVRQECEVIES